MEYTIFELAICIAFNLLDNANFVGVGVNEKEDLILLYTNKMSMNEEMDKFCSDALQDTKFKHVFVNKNLT